MSITVKLSALVGQSEWPGKRAKEIRAGGSKSEHFTGSAGQLGGLEHVLEGE